MLGGIGIFFSFIVTWMGVSLWLGHTTIIGSMYPLALGCVFIFGLGLLDDFTDIKPYHKLLGQIVIASFLVIFGFQIQWFTSMSVNLIVSILWMVGITNALISWIIWTGWQ